MSRLEWVVCERTGHWAAALRTALDRAGWTPALATRLFELRRLDELAARLESHPDAFALVAIERATLGDVLGWLVQMSQTHRQTRFIALLDRDVWESDSSPRRHRRQSAIDALREAGASDVVTSPRQLHGLLELARSDESLQRSSGDGSSAEFQLFEQFSPRRHDGHNE